MVLHVSCNGPLLVALVHVSYVVPLFLGYDKLNLEGHNYFYRYCLPSYNYNEHFKCTQENSPKIVLCFK